MAEYGTNITWESYPDYDEWLWDDYWQCTDWMIWYERLLEHFGEVEAKFKWKSAWEKQSSGSATWSCLYNEVFRNFVEDNGLGLESYIADVVKTSQGIVKDTLGFASWITRNAKWIIPIGLVVVGGGYLYFQGSKLKGAANLSNLLK